MSKETRQFETEVKQILDLMVNSLYSHREIFLRELISNSSDALDKLSFEEINHKDWATADKHIRLAVDKENKTLTIQDNGIGMSREEVIQNIGTIAYSGTKSFLKNAQKIKECPELIGQFGVGFYAAFMVADKVIVHTQRAGETTGTVWESNGDGNYSLEEMTRPLGTGTSITLHMKDLSAEENPQDFLEEWTLRSIVKKYSDFIEYPVKMLITSEVPELDEEGKPVEGKMKKEVKDETFNSQKAIWLRDSKEIKEEEYKEFYKHVTNDWNEPLDQIHYRAEGTQEFSALLYIPGSVPMDYNQREMKYGPHLYVKRVFISDNCEELVPQHLRFVKGVVDSSDLPLNVSRELIQKDRQITLINKAVVSKILRHLKKMMTKDRETYVKFWKNFGSTLKEGIAMDFTNKDAITDLSLFKSSEREGYITLKEYVEKMPESQKDIYYMTGDSLDIMKTSPYLEKLKEKGYEVLLFTDPVDEWVLNSLTEYDKKKMLSITKGDLDLSTEEEKKEKEKELEATSNRLKPLCESMQKALNDSIKDVKVTDRLVKSPVCLVSGENDPSAHMERMLEKMGQAAPKTKRTLEINPKHPIFSKMEGFSEEKIANWSEILYNQALLNEGSQIKDPVKFSEQLAELMVSA